MSRLQRRMVESEIKSMHRWQLVGWGMVGAKTWAALGR